MKRITALSMAAALAFAVAPAANAQLIGAAGGATTTGTGLTVGSVGTTAVTAVAPTATVGLGGLGIGATALGVVGATVVVIGVATSEQTSGTN